MVVSSFADERRGPAVIPVGRAGSLPQTAGQDVASPVSALPEESFGCHSLLGIHWRRRTLDATAGGEAHRNRILST
jgi:hypothetical protein